ncbi:hypothetical protein PV05_01160 [Exophiala xenobiotica]|uniref:Uncharacterized protein n=1 Tax=Exophiala xenobiotica TaxID=348802 RepID=A0A0D2EZ55_9EURO|nr:uncharacterized protein PV05_01160 [Exophiala xenobiotica]KIW60988.1 hypothetical protein PV05_01160 [Exophiala xenobiotica]
MYISPGTDGTGRDVYRAQGRLEPRQTARSCEIPRATQNHVPIIFCTVASNMDLFSTLLAAKSVNFSQQETLNHFEIKSADRGADKGEYIET